MWRNILHFFRKSDWILSLAVFFLSAFGLMALYSIESTAEPANFIDFKKQALFIVAGIALLVVVGLLDYRFARSYGGVLYAVGIVALVGVLVFGTTVRGTRGWLFVGGQGFQPVELVKLFLIIVIAQLLQRWRLEVSTWRRLVTVAAVALPSIGLVLWQPDFGSAVMLLAIFLGMLLLAKIKTRFVVVIAVILLVTSVASWFFFLRDYQKERIMTFLDPTRDPYGSGYNIQQSIIAVGSGTWFGRGLSLGSQSRLHFLPAQRTDFIFAVIAEELGFIGASLVIVCFGVIIWRLVAIARRSRDSFGAMIVGGLAVYFTCQTVLNIGMNIGLLPIAGVTLPFVSYGGSSLMISFLAIGLAQSIRVRSLTPIE
ncbi:MAG: rod shape-determining protein RodA [Patescibacteria group bacterium]